MNRRRVRRRLFPVLAMLWVVLAGCALSRPSAPAAPGPGLLGVPAAPAAPPAAGTGPAGTGPLPGPVTVSLVPPGTALPSPHEDGDIVDASSIPGVDPSARLAGIQFGVLGNPGRILHAAVLMHGDGPSYYLRSVLGTRSSPTSDRRRIEEALGPGAGMMFAFPKSQPGIWPGFGYEGRNGASIVAIFRYLIDRTGNPALRCHYGGMSGGSLPLNSFLATIDSDPSAAAFAAANLATITDHDALCRAIKSQKAGYIRAAARYPGLRLNFIHGHGGKMVYVRGHHEEVGRAVSGTRFDLPYVCPDTIRLGRLRFWSGPSHWECFKGQIHRSMFGE